VVSFSTLVCFSPVCFALSMPVQVIAWKTLLPNDLSYVEQDVKLYLLTDVHCILLYVTDDGISIPCQYTSYVAPLSSSKLWNEARSCRDHNKPIEVSFHPLPALCIQC